MLKKLLFGALFHLPFFLFAQSPIATITDWKNDAKGAYSFIHDDYGDNAVRGINDYADTIARNRGLKFTIGAITSSCQTNLGMWADAVSMINYGHEIINHTHSHTCAIGNAWCTTGLWAEPATEDFANEMTKSTNLINTNTGHYPRYFIYPYDLFNDAANNHLKSLGYIGSRTGTYNGSDNTSFTPDASGFFKSSFIVDTDGSAILESNLNKYVDQAIADNSWINREMHNVGASGWGHIPVTDYRGHLNYIKSKVDAGDLWVGTISEVLTYQIQKLNYTPTTTYNAVSGEITVSWNTPSFNVANYLLPLQKKSPITIKVDLDGIPSVTSVTQNGNPITSYDTKGGFLFFNAYPSQGSIVIKTKPCTVLCLQTKLKDTTVNVGDNLILKPVFTYIGSISYAWYFNDVLMVGETNSTLSLTNTQLSNAGTYKVIATVGSEILQTSCLVSVIYRAPYNGTPINIPGTVEFEHYDIGGQNISFFDSSPTNEGSALRSDAVDIEAKTGGGNNIGWTVANEWLEYTVNISTWGLYSVKIAHASTSFSSKIQLFVNNASVSGDLAMTPSGGWQTWKNTTFSGISLPAGKHVLRVKIVVGNVNLDKMEFTLDKNTTAINNTISSSGIEVFPNPTTTQFEVKGDNIQNIRILNFEGKILENHTAFSSSVFVGEALCSGIYLLEITTNEGVFREKIMKQ